MPGNSSVGISVVAPDGERHEYEFVDCPFPPRPYTQREESILGGLSSCLGHILTEYAALQYRWTKHMKVLEKLGYARQEKDGNWYYKLDDDNFHVRYGGDNARED